MPLSVACQKIRCLKAAARQILRHAFSLEQSSKSPQPQLMFLEDKQPPYEFRSLPREDDQPLEHHLGLPSF